MSITTFISLCAGISATCTLLFIINVFGKLKLEKNQTLSKPVSPLMKLLMPLLPLTRPFAARSIFESWRNMDEGRLKMAGYFELIPPVDFLALRFLFFAVGIAFIFFGTFSKHPMLCLIIGVLLAFFPTFWLNGVIKKRHESIMKALPNVLDLLTLSIESGRDLLSSLRDILERRKMDDLGEELTRTFQEIQFGRPRSEALRELARRVKQVDLTATVNAIVQAEEYGVSIGHLLKIQGEMQRNKRFALAEKLANESSVKIIIPVVICILPAVFIILMGPLLAQASRLL